LSEGSKAVLNYCEFTQQKLEIKLIRLIDKHIHGISDGKCAQKNVHDAHFSVHIMMKKSVIDEDKIL